MRFSLKARMTAELVGTAFLLAAVVGSGIMGERLSAGNVAIALLANTIATGAALVSLILTFGSVSGAHFNPAVTLADASQEGIPWGEVPGYLIAQITGAYVGVACAHLMFGLPLFSASRHARSGASPVFSEFVATFGLLSVIRAVRGCARPLCPLRSVHISQPRIGSPNLQHSLIRLFRLPEPRRILSVVFDPLTYRALSSRSWLGRLRRRHCLDG